MKTVSVFCCRVWKKSPKAEGIANVGLDQVTGGQKTKFIRWKVHDDWIQQVDISVIVLSITGFCT